MISAETIRAAGNDAGALELFRRLGYPIDPVPICLDAWRRGGIIAAWEGGETMLAARLPEFDLFLVQDARGFGSEEARQFLHSYRLYQCKVKSAIVFKQQQTTRLSLYDINDKNKVRRLDVDLAEPSSQAIDRLNLLDLSAGSSSDISRLFDRALDRENISRQFFLRFRSAVHRVAAALRSFDPKASTEAVEAQSLLILSRVLFLSFVEVKGWLNQERRFLGDRLAESRRRETSFYATVLQPLFFGCLNTPLAARDRSAMDLGRIPYLNGGLFEPAPFEKRHPDLVLDNELMSEVIEGVFGRFDFRIDEGDEAGLHVDPEMLGKVFESLMAGDERAASGSYYTPRAVVEAMARSAIREWLCEGNTSIRRELEAEGLSPLKALSLLERLGGITVLDPACGSGAFLLAALQEIECLHRGLAQRAGVSIARDLRQQIVERSLFGVDLKPEAVRLCELRLWLAIVSGSDLTLDDVQPLPNLDRNILQGNSLLAPTDFLGDARADVYREWRTALRAQSEVIARYRTAGSQERPMLARLIAGHDRRIASELLAQSIERDEQELGLVNRSLFDHVGSTGRLQELRERIEASRRKLEEVEAGELDFFAYDVHFAHVLGAGGFAVVIGNPPWVRNNRIDPRARRMYADRYRSFRRERRQTAFHQPDLYVPFVERSLSLAANGGVVSMLLPAKICNAAYASTLRSHLAGEASLVEITDWTDDSRAVFDADTFPLSVNVVRGRKRQSKVTVHHGESTWTIASSHLVDDRGQWRLIPERVACVLQDVESRCSTIETVLGRRPFMGIKTGDNDRFFVDGIVIGDALRTPEGVTIPLRALSRCVRGRDVRRWRTTESRWMIWPPLNGWPTPPQWLVELSKCRAVSVPPLHLAFVKPEHVGIKVVWKDLARGMSAVVLPECVTVAGKEIPLVPNQTLYVLDATSLDEAYAIAAVLNSSVADAWFLATAERAKDRHYRYFGRTVAALPVPELGRADLSRLARKAHAGTDIRDDLDHLTAELYGLSSSDLDALRCFIADRLDVPR